MLFLLPFFLSSWSPVRAHIGLYGSWIEEAGLYAISSLVWITYVNVGEILLTVIHVCSSSSLPWPKDISKSLSMLGMVTWLGVTNKMQAAVTGAISGQKHLRLRAGLASLLPNAVAKQEATCWEGDVEHSDTANSPSVRVTVWCEKQMLHLRLQICIRNCVWMRIFWWLKPLRFENCFFELWSRSLKQGWKFPKDNSSNPHSTVVKQVVFLSMSLSSLPMNEKIKIEAWRDEEASPLSMGEPGLTCWMLLFKSPLLFF